MDVPPHIQDFWSEFVSSSGRDPRSKPYDCFHFGGRKEDANELAALVLLGEKRATASLLWQYEQEGRRPPQAGDVRIVTDWDGNPLCVIEAAEVEVLPFEEVSADFAAAEGEGDRSLQYWRDVHWSFFGRVCERIGRERTHTMPVVCERFKVRFQAKSGR